MYITCSTRCSSVSVLCSLLSPAWICFFGLGWLPNVMFESVSFPCIFIFQLQETRTRPYDLTKLLLHNLSVLLWRQFSAIYELSAHHSHGLQLVGQSCHGGRRQGPEGMSRCSGSSSAPRPPLPGWPQLLERGRSAVRPARPVVHVHPTLSQ